MKRGLLQVLKPASCHDQHIRENTASGFAETDHNQMLFLEFDTKYNHMQAPRTEAINCRLNYMSTRKRN
jgi:hypothetical protein